ncbi:ImmA/IrrE family metallo-endopeptidase [Pedobacter frigidisoli]|jgi:Zn-dependent peptidase ImmA (M78 family)|uniref:ImmA/IrrE family metallo-endopeptidase n=1 Tax=Pedobacter frigidisoli TaxID=2530455 RepID=A0A4V6N6A2_9SPHI|nr:ImmA/IrrE family metallo-endopeptidase [Pedobacter frigidisoli]TCD12966.1 ImmA/IrrE family metallo-endopeptidase [Pedobacter frigidisoli]
MISDKKKSDIENIALDALYKSNSLGVFPTPVDKILKYAELRVDSSVDLSKAPSNFFLKKGLALKSGWAKIRGVLDRTEKVIYLDLNQHASKQKFVKLHEVGHELCGWQSNMLKYLDDDETLDPDINDMFESEANYFASSALFQVQIFNEKVGEYPLELATCLQLQKLFGGSFHATIRRYVEHSKKRCALLVLNKESKSPFSTVNLSLRNYFQSPSFTKELGQIEWETTFDYDVPFVQNYLSNRRMMKSELVIESGGGEIPCDYHYFDNSYNIFVFMFPKGELIKSRTSFVLTN